MYPHRKQDRMKTIKIINGGMKNEKISDAAGTADLPDLCEED